jgi:hypothetical protein
MKIVVALLLVQVTTADGAKVFINPEFVTKLYPTKEAAHRAPNELVVKGARCVVTTSDGKFLSVLEECDYLRALFEGQRPRRR